FYFFFSSRRRHTRSKRDWSSDVCSSDLSKESIADSAINLTALIAENIQEQKVNTLNEKIGNVLKTFTAKEVSDVDALKAIINVRSEERRVGKECRSMVSTDSAKIKKINR